MKQAAEDNQPQPDHRYLMMTSDSSAANQQDYAEREKQM
jgi:hypothetical protein